MPHRSSHHYPAKSIWRAQLGAKLVSPDEAVSHIKSGDRVTMSISQATPFVLCAALAGRLMEIENVVVNHSAALFNWDLPGLGERFRLESFYLSPIDRELFTAGRARIRAALLLSRRRAAARTRQFQRLSDARIAARRDWHTSISAKSRSCRRRWRAMPTW